jgi:hypothetical protein
MPIVLPATADASPPHCRPHAATPHRTGGSLKNRAGVAALRACYVPLLRAAHVDQLQLLWHDRLLRRDKCRKISSPFRTVIDHLKSSFFEL